MSTETGVYLSWECVPDQPGEPRSAAMCMLPGPAGGAATLRAPACMRQRPPPAPRVLAARSCCRPLARSPLHSPTPRRRHPCLHPPLPGYYRALVNQTYLDARGQGERGPSAGPLPAAAPAAQPGSCCCCRCRCCARCLWRPLLLLALPLALHHPLTPPHHSTHTHSPSSHPHRVRLRVWHHRHRGLPQLLVRPGLGLMCDVPRTAWRAAEGCRQPAGCPAPAPPAHAGDGPPPTAQPPPTRSASFTRSAASAA